MLAKMTNYAQKFYHKFMMYVTYTDKYITIHWHCINNDSTCNISDNSK